ncbi:MAG: oligopeptide/dipeptide ABC transporter ATP-binding protein, partial [Acidimicrobiia bacterium]
PYTRALLDSRPRVDLKATRLQSIEGQPPSLTDLPPGCRFAVRCAYAIDRCHHEYPTASTISADHVANCWRSEEVLWASR